MKEYSSEAQFLHVLADAARQETMKRFRGGQDIHIDTKPKQGFSFDPVTDADREAERVIRSLIEARYPDHKISGEEFGTTVSRNITGSSILLMAHDRLFVVCLSGVP